MAGRNKKGGKTCVKVRKENIKKDRKIKSKGPNTNNEHRCSNKKMREKNKVLQHATKKEQGIFCKNLKKENQVKIENSQDISSTGNGNRKKNEIKKQDDPDDKIIYPCEKCDKVFLRKRYLQSHMQVHQANEIFDKEDQNKRKPCYECENCGKTFKIKRYLRNHMKIHTTGKPLHKCDVCDKTFLLPTYLRSHQTIHTGVKPYTCHTCGKSFRDVSNLNKHMKIHKKKFDAALQSICDLCGKGFSARYNLNQHIKIVHNMERPFPCNECEKTYKTKYCLDLHKLSHTGDRPHQCEVCQKTFKDKCNMRKHMIIHNNERQFQCSLCNLAFNRRDQLKVHSTIHSWNKVKPFQCDLCPKAYRNMAYLKAHMSIHKCNDKFKCSTCEKSFSCNSNLKMHTKKVHNGIKIKMKGLKDKTVVDNEPTEDDSMKDKSIYVGNNEEDIETVIVTYIDKLEKVEERKEDHEKTGTCNVIIEHVENEAIKEEFNNSRSVNNEHVEEESMKSQLLKKSTSTDDIEHVDEVIKEGELMSPSNIDIEEAMEEELQNAGNSNHGGHIIIKHVSTDDIEHVDEVMKEEELISESNIDIEEAMEEQNASTRNHGGHIIIKHVKDGEIKEAFVNTTYMNIELENVDPDIKEEIKNVLAICEENTTK